MISPTKIVQLKFSNFFISTAATIGLILSFWLLFYALSSAGCPLPAPEIARFHDLGFFALSSFSLIIFLTMIPFQRVEEKLSPGFYARVIHTPWANFGLYVLFFSAVASFIAIVLHHQLESKNYLHPLFLALVSSMVSAILFHYFWVRRYLYNSYIVYTNIAQLTQEEQIQDIWLELLECSHKAIGDKRLNDGKHVLLVLEQLYQKVKKQERLKILEEDLEALYESADQLRPLQRQMERQWPFLTAHQ